MITKMYNLLKTIPHLSSLSDSELIDRLKHLGLEIVVLYGSDSDSSDIAMYKFRSQVYQKAKNKALLEEMKNINKLLSRAKIPYVFLKGPLLGEMLYTQNKLKPSMRITRDIDILIPAHSMSRAFDVLGQDGYMSRGKTICGYFYDNYLHENQNYGPRHVHYPDVSKGDLNIELHTTGYKVSPNIDITEYNELAMDNFLKRQLIEFENYSYPYLNTTDLLLQLCSHFSKHILTAMQYVACEVQDNEYPTPFRNLIDIALLINLFKDYYMKNFKYITERAITYSSFSSLFLCLSWIIEFVPEFHPIYEGIDMYRDMHEPMDIDEDMLLYLADNISLSKCLTSTWSEIMSLVRGGLLPRFTYRCASSKEMALNNIVTSRSSVNYKFEWRAYCTSVKNMTIEWELPKEYIVLPKEKNSDGWQIHPQLSDNDRISVGFILSSNNCLKCEKHCASYYEIPLNSLNKEDNKLYRIGYILDPPTLVNPNIYDLDIIDNGQSITIKLTLKNLYDFIEVRDNRLYFDITCTFPPDNHKTAGYLSWSRTSIYYSIKCMYCGLLVLTIRGE